MKTKLDRRSTLAERLQYLSECPILVDPADALKVLQISRQKLDRLVTSGKLENAVIYGKRELFRRAEIRALIEA